MKLNYGPFREIIVAFRERRITRAQMVAMWSLEQARQNRCERWRENG